MMKKKNHSTIVFSLSLIALIFSLGFLDLHGEKTLKYEVKNNSPGIQKKSPDLAIHPQSAYSYACGQMISVDSDPKSYVSMGNPAAKYCMDLGYVFTTITNPDGSQDGTCTFPDETTCNAWEFLQGYCGQEHNACAQKGLQTRTLSDGKNAFSREYAVCIDENGRNITSATDMIQLFSAPLSGSEADRIHQEDEGRKENSHDKNKETSPSDVGTLPSSFDWRNYDGSNWLTAVKNQGGCGSCWSFSAVGVTEAVHNIDNNNPSLDLNLSEQYLVTDCFSYSNCCGGWHDYALEFIRDSGVPDESCMPYVDGAGCSCDDNCANCNYNTGDNCSDKTCSDRCADWASRLTHISSTGYVGTDPGAIKQALIDYGPLAVTMGIGSDYGGHFDSDIYRCTIDDGLNHALVLVGYDDAGGYWIIRNSWGSTWNGDGYFKVGFGECDIEHYVYYADLCTNLDIAINPPGAGTVIADPTPNCGSTGYTPGTEVQLTASPAIDFSHWSGNASGSDNPTSIIMDEDKLVVANFSTVSYEGLTINEVYPGTPDRIELHNQGPSSVNLAGLELQDSYESVYTFPTFTLDPGAYVVIHEYGNSSSNTDTDLYTEANIDWVIGSGSTGIIEPITGAGIDFLRWGFSSTPPPPGTGWTGTNPDGPIFDLNLGRDEYSTDTDDGSDWCTQSSSLGFVNVGCGLCYTPGIPPLQFPENGSTTFNSRPDFSWLIATASNEYQIQIDEDPLFPSPITSNTIWIEYTPPSPLVDDTYYWRVRGHYTNDGCDIYGDWSDTWHVNIDSTLTGEVLLVDGDDNYPDVISIYTDTLTSLGKTYVVWETGGSSEPAIEDLNNFDIVIWFTGDSYSGIGYAGETALGSWLDTGKCLLVSSQDYLFDRGLTPFIDDYLGVDNYQSDVGQHVITGTANIFGGLGPYTLDYFTLVNWSDRISPDPDAGLAFRGDLGDAGVYKDNGVYKTTFWGFPFEAIPGAAGRQDVMAAFLNWCLPYEVYVPLVIR